MIVRFDFDEEDTEVLKKISKAKNMDIPTYVSTTFKYLLECGVNAKHCREEIIKLDEEFPDQNELYQKKLKAIINKYEGFE